MTINHMLPKPRFFGLYFSCRQHGSESKHCWIRWDNTK